MMRILQSLATVLVVAAAVPASADLTVVSKLSADGKTQTAISYLTADKARIVQPGGHEVIFDAARSEITLIDNNKKQYFVMMKQEMEDAAARMQQQKKHADAKMEDAMKKVPPEMREKMKSMIDVGGMMASAVEVQKATGGRQIAGYKCENWILTIGEMFKTEECLSTDVPYPTEAWQSFRSLQTILQSMGPAMSSASALREKTKELKGFPLASTTTANVLGNTHTTSSEVQEIKQGAIAANVFDLPAGYKKVESPLKSMSEKR
jgi:hypothetical protein